MHRAQSDDGADKVNGADFDLDVCLVIPFYNHEASIAGVIQELKPLGLPCFLVNDGSHERCDAVLSQIERQEGSWVRLIRYQPNQGKGMAVMTGLAAAAEEGYTHAVQIDADGQHRVIDVRTLLQLATDNPQAMITGYAVYDQSVPKSRLYARYLTHVWVWINTLSLRVRDSMCGLRVYPLQVTLDVWRQSQRSWLWWIGKRMSFDVEILVHLCWRNVPIINTPVPVTYPTDGVSHFRVWLDNWQISSAHARLFVGMVLRLPVLAWRALRRIGSAA